MVEPSADGGSLEIYRAFEQERQELGSIPLTATRGELTKAFKMGAEAVTLRLPSNLVLRKRVRFPAATAENILQVVGFEMDRLTPFTAAQVHYDCQIVETSEEDGEIVVELAVVPRNRISELLHHLQRLGLRVGVIDTHHGWEEMNLLARADRPGPSGIGVFHYAALWSLVALLLTAVLLTPLWQQRGVAIVVEQRAEQARQQATAVTALRNEVDQMEELLNQIPKRRSELRPAVDILRELTELLPDDTWIQQLDLRAGQLELRGLSRQATALIEKIESSPSFSATAFRSPVLQAGGEQRFHLGARINRLELAGDPSLHNELMISGE